MMLLSWFFLFSQFVYALSYEHAQMVTLVEWQQKCRTGGQALNECNWCRCNTKNKYSCAARVCSEVDPFGHFNEWQQKCRSGEQALNDCNWCRCNTKNKYSCAARVCSEVDPFGHFNDAIAQINVGMEGKGSWRSDKKLCEPGVEYRRTDIVCICNEDGTWPNPVCRDIFRVLHQVEATDEREPNQQKCTANKLYLFGCNVCFCPSSGQIDPEFCTKKTCTGQDDILEIKEDINDDEENTRDELAIYATCTPEKKYSLGCKECVCLKNNRLHCSNCTIPRYEKRNQKSRCASLAPGQVYTEDCNLCLCDENGYAYCTVKKCLKQSHIFPKKPSYNRLTDDKHKADKSLNLGFECVPGQTFNKGCNKCTCMMVEDGKSGYFCTLHKCLNPSRLGTSFENNLKALNQDCVVNTAYEVNCMICECGMNDKGEKYEYCQVNPKCNNDTLEDLDNLHGYCEPLHVYKKDCNICKCLTDGKTVRCTANVCDGSHRDQEPITIDVVPVSQPGEPCPSGSSYRIDCNICFCLNNGNAICTTIDCNKPQLSKK